MKNWHNVLAAVLAVVFCFGLAHGQEGEKVKVLLVTNDTWGEGDSAVLERMEANGYEVLSASHSEVDSTWADGMDLVYVSSSVSSVQVTNKFRNVEVPVIMIEPYAQDDMGMTLDSDEMRHFQPIQRPIVIIAEGHFLAAGMTGEIDLFDNYETQSGQGYPGDGGVVIAEYLPLPGDEEISSIIYGAIYCYEKGAVLADTSDADPSDEEIQPHLAAERRYFAGWNDNGAAYFNDLGWKLWQASIDWCLYKDQETRVADKPVTPSGLALEQNYPNPFNPSTVISFTLPNASDVRLTVYDLAGRTAAMVLNARLEAGSHQATFDASQLAGGVYFYTLEADGHRLTQKMTLLK